MAIGYSQQARYKSVMMKKNQVLQHKYLTYQKHVNQYHLRYPDSPVLRLPTLEELKALTVNDAFWNVGSLTHPIEPWAVDKATQAGIQAHRTVQSCEEELCRIAPEVHKMVRWTLDTKDKLDGLLELRNMGVYPSISKNIKCCVCHATDLFICK